LNFSQIYPSDSRKKEEYFIKLCLELASLGKGSVSPNPLVGAVVVKNNRIVGIGYHKRPGLSHAEKIAIDDAGKDARGADLYVNLEPCVHYGRTPPCVDYIIKKGIKRVYIGTVDPNPVVKGKGLRKLKRAGLDAKSGILEQECRDLNRKYFTFYEKNKIFVALKLAISLDGKIATEKGESKWISSESSRVYAHKLRGEFDLIAVGRNTLLKDDSSLVPYLCYSPSPPVPVIICSRKINFNRKVFKLHKRVILATPVSYKNLPENVEILKTKVKDKKVDLKNMLKRLHEKGFQSILFEGGAELVSSLLKNNLIDEYHIFITPFIIGSGISAFKSFKLKSLSQKRILDIKEMKTFDGTIYLRLS